MSRKDDEAGLIDRRLLRMRDPYQILGVTKASSAEEIKSAYRKLAKKLHPDVNPGRKDIEQKFKEVTAAYDLLSDTDKRARFDRGEVDAQGNERGFSGGDPFGSGRQWRGRAGSAGGSGGGNGGDPFSQFGGAGVEDIFAEFMGGGRGRRGAPLRGNDITYTLSVPFAQAALGGQKRVTLADGKTIDVTIPPGTDEGHKLRLRGQGQVANGGSGDAIIEIHIEPHPHFTRKGNDLMIEVPVSLPEAVLGASIKVPTIDGYVTLKVPKGAQTGTVLRLKGKGIPSATGEAGDMFAKIKIMLPDTVPADLSDWVEKWAKKHAYDPRQKLGWE
ncbi:MAG: DnaJ domain-containing protein [Pseudomonadota bacterium]|nr:DnaJ domain-containing protein [Pseudomonadota bacterium]